MTKAYQNYNQLIEHIKSKNILIDIDEITCIKILKSINYYRLSAYWRPFNTDKNGYDCNGVKLSHIIRLYQLDNEMRILLFKPLCRIEPSVRAAIATIHSSRYGALGYEKQTNFRKSISANLFNEQTRLIEKHIPKNNPEIIHYFNKYNAQIPLWVCVEHFSFGLLSKFYSNMKMADQKTVASLLQVPHSVLRSYLKCLTDLRNKVAHHAKFCHLTFSSKIELNRTFPYNKQDTLFSYLLAIKDLYQDVDLWQTEVYQPLNKLRADYKEFCTFAVYDFPSNWQNILEK